MRSINLIVIHCSASANGVYITPKQVDGWHAAPPKSFRRQPAAVAKLNKDLPHIGYHWLISTDGIARSGRATEEIGAHVAGHNANSIGICMAGFDRYYLSQWSALSRLLCDLAQLWQKDRLVPAERVAYPLRPVLAMRQFAKMGIEIKGHRDLSPDKNGDGKITSNEWLKTCPGFDVASWLAAGMTPLGTNILDGDPSIASASPIVRARQVDINSGAA